MSRWFRMYDELLDDPKVQRLSGEDFKAWVNILCLASRNDGTLPAVQDIAFALRMDAKKAAAMFGRLQSAGLIAEDGDGFTPNKWNARQYKSDVSTGRVKRFRERSKPVSGTPVETAPDTETDTEVPLSNDNGDGPKTAPALVDPEKQFWDSAKAHLQAAGKTNPGPIIGKWCKDYSKSDVRTAITRSQIEKAVEPVSFIEAVLRGSRREALRLAEGPAIC